MSFLEKIMPGKQLEAKEFAQRFAIEAPARSGAMPIRDFAAALARPQAVIAEVKHKSPSNDTFVQTASPASLAAAYRRGGAAALSVVTDQSHFGTSLADVPAMREASGLPVLVKDFVVAESQILAAWEAGADAVLLIARLLDKVRLTELLLEVHRLGLQSLVECHDEEDIDKSVKAGARVLGINNRNLASLKTDISQTPRLLPLVPEGIIKVSESGISTRAQIEDLSKAGADAFLIGHALLLSPDPGRKVRELTGLENEGAMRVKVCGLTNIPDASGSFEAGADILGMVMAPGPRQMDLSGAQAIRTALPDARLCGVFVDASKQEIADAVEQVGFDLVQLHGQESPDFCRELKGLIGTPLIKVLPYEDFSPDLIEAFDAAAYFLVDFPKTKEVANLSEAQARIRLQARAVRNSGKEVFLAGGLNPENLGDALAVDPFAVDVSRGVEAQVGHKDLDKIKKFIQGVKG